MSTFYSECLVPIVIVILIFSHMSFILKCTGYNVCVSVSGEGTVSPSVRDVG